MNDKEFKYTYSAPTAEEKKEILKIQSQYLPKERDTKEARVVQLKKLDVIVKAPAKVVAIITGVIGFCCFGFGMTMSLEWQIISWGAILGIIGLVLMAVAYPIFNKILAKRKKKYAEQILALSHVLLNEDNEENVSLDIKQVPTNKDEE